MQFAILSRLSKRSAPCSPQAQSPPHPHIWVHPTAPCRRDLILQDLRTLQVYAVVSSLLRVSGVHRFLFSLLPRTLSSFVACAVIAGGCRYQAQGSPGRFAVSSFIRCCPMLHNWHFGRRT